MKCVCDSWWDDFLGNDGIIFSLQPKKRYVILSWITYSAPGLVFIVFEHFGDGSGIKDVSVGCPIPSVRTDTLFGRKWWPDRVLHCFVLQYFVNGMSLVAELWCERQRFSTKWALLQQEVLYAEVVFSLCIPFYGCFTKENNILAFIFCAFHAAVRSIWIMHCWVKKHLNC